MKNKISFYYFLIAIFIVSCSDNDDPDIVGVDDFSGTFRLSYVAGKDACTNSSSTKNSTSSENDLEIFPNGRFKRKIYSQNANNECVVEVILEGQITITHSRDKNPVGTVEYDDLEKTDKVWITKSVNGIHNELLLIAIENNVNVSYNYGRSD